MSKNTRIIIIALVGLTAFCAIAISLYPIAARQLMFMLEKDFVPHPAGGRFV
jgi:hypothetical protein